MSLDQAYEFWLDQSEATVAPGGVHASYVVCQGFTCNSVLVLDEQYWRRPDTCRRQWHQEECMQVMWCVRIHIFCVSVGRAVLEHQTRRRWPRRSACKLCGVSRIHMPSCVSVGRAVLETTRHVQATVAPGGVHASYVVCQGFTCHSVLVLDEQYWRRPDTCRRQWHQEECMQAMWCVKDSHAILC
ncbi:hypothetical protein J6590_074231 [Homalodisca vitripennis]|nr:hypothetical protein J6590_074231 [Homalodisca vitripennis]